MNNLPQPLTPADCDLRDFAFMPLDVARLRDSDLASDETPEACWAAVLLWCVSWHQVPAGSLPDDNEWIAKRARYWHRGKIDKDWPEVREGALRGWVKCSDGRLYHPVVAEKARDAWIAKLKQRFKTECNRIKKHCQRHQIEYIEPDFDEWMAAGCPVGQPLGVPGTKQQCLKDGGAMSPATDGESPGSAHGETASKGQGEGYGQGQGEGQLTKKSDSGGSEASAGDGPPDSENPPPLSADAIGAELVRLEAERGKTLRLSSRAHEALLRIAGRNVVMSTLLRAHALARTRREDPKAPDPSPINPGFLEPFIDEALAESLPGTPSGPAWDETTEGVEAMAASLGMVRQPHEHDIVFRLRVIREHGDPRLIERELDKAERMNPAEFERVHRLMYGRAPGQVAA